MNHDDFSYDIGRMAVEAMLCEIAATPKPGLVDQNNSGAHDDMDFFTFMTSIAALHPVFEEFSRLGERFSHAPVEDAFSALREYGVKADELMFRATRGINTHKGMIFSLGLVSGAAGLLYGRESLIPDNLCGMIRKLCDRLCEREYRGLEVGNSLTKGERVYLSHGLRGVRGEAESGYLTVQKISYPVLHSLFESGYPVNDILVHSLLHLIAHTADTNIVSRHGPETAAYARTRAKNVLEQGGILTPEGKAAVLEMDTDFINRHISPGGCADLLAVTYLLYCIGQKYA